MVVVLFCSFLNLKDDFVSVMEMLRENSSVSRQNDSLFLNSLSSITHEKASSIVIVTNCNISSQEFPLRFLY